MSKKSMNKINFDDYADDYDDLTGKNVRFFSSNDSYFSWIKIHLMQQCLEKKPSKILEYGAGIGRNLPFLMKAFPESEIWACDISEKSLQKIHEKFPAVKTFVVGDLLPVNAREFNLVLIAGVFHHVEPAQRENTALFVKELMSDRAELFVFEHNPYNLVTRALVERCPYDEDASLVYPREIKKIIRGTGMIVRQIRYYLYFPPYLHLWWLEQALGRIPLGGQYFIRAMNP